MIPDTPQSSTEGFPPGAAANDARRRVVRLSGQLLLDCARLISTAVDTDLVTGSMFVAISRDNTRRITQEALSHPHYSGLRDIPPDDLREPVSAYVLAREFSMPYETVRRHVGKLMKAGLVERVDNGLIIPTSVHARPALIHAVDETYRVVARFVREAAAIGATHRVTDVPEVREADVRRQVLRLAINVYLESIAQLSAVLEMNLSHALIYVCLVQANVSHLVRERVSNQPYSGLEDVPPDADRRPASVYSIARQMGLPYETVRRNLSQMVALGLAERVGRAGYLSPAAVHQRPAWIAATEESWALVQRFLDDLARVGVVAGRA